MNQEDYFKKLISEFEIWYQNDIHSRNISYYDGIITKEYLSLLSDSEFLDFFFDFVKDGGKVQSGGHRKKYDFWAETKYNLADFKQFVLEPFDSDFNLKDWMKRRNNFYAFGFGIATIYLNRIDRLRYPILNNKTLNALNKIGYKISSSKNFSNYELVKSIQDKLISSFPVLKDYYKADALNHFLIAVYQGQELISNYQQIDQVSDVFEQREIEYLTKEDLNKLNKEELLQTIKNCERDSSQAITIKGKSYKRYNYLMTQIKKYCDYKCQFCSTAILKANGDYYIEACHIKPKAKGGKDKLNNILVLCPNCHKLFDFGKREKETYSFDNYSVCLNGEKYITTLK